jgi:hypothetical protein
VKTPQKPFVYSLTLKKRRKKYLPSIPLILLSNSVAGFLQTMMQNHIEKSVAEDKRFYYHHIWHQEKWAGGRFANPFSK